MTENNKDIIRASRKDEHINYFLKNRNTVSNGFEDVFLHNNSIPEINFDEICTELIFLNKKISFPLIINAMTGGTDFTKEINQNLSMLANKYNIPIAVGSQTIAINDSKRKNSFEVVREYNDSGIVIANLSALSSISNISSAVEMIEADAVQLHLNAPQEMCMEEGDRRFRGILDNIQKISNAIKVPVIVKETGFGMSYETVKKLYNASVRIVDISGKGGTNFIQIENNRNNNRNYDFLANWGIPTALSLLECRKVSKNMKIICSGGITKSEEITKALTMGADLVGISGKILETLLTQGYEQAEKLIESLIYETKVIMLLLGAKNINELKQKQFLVKGETKELIKSKFL